MKRRFIHSLATTLESNGIRIFKENNSSSIVWRLIFSIVYLGLSIVSMLMFSVQNYKNFIKLLNPLITVSAISGYCGGVLVLFHHRQTVSQILYQMDNYIYLYEDKLDVRYKWYLREETFEIFMSAVWYFHFVAIGFVSSPGVIELIRFGKVTHYLYPCWTPWNREDVKMQAFTLILEFSQTIIAARFNYLIIVAIFMMIFEFLRQYETLRIAIHTLDERSQVFVLSSNRKEDIFKMPHEVFDEKVRRNIIEYIKHHQLLHQTFALFKKWFQVFFSMELATTMFSFSLGFYVIFEAFDEEIFLYITAVSVTTVNILCRCYIGEMFSDLNNQIKDLIFYETWFWEMTAKNRRLLSVFHLMLDQPFYLRGFSIFGASLSMFGSIIRKTYSIFNVLSASLNE